MGNQQLILLVLGTIIVGIAVAVGITEFRSYHDEAVGDEMQEAVLLMAADARQYFEKPKTLGGGEGSFAGYRAPKWAARTPNATYTHGFLAGGQGIFFTGFAMSMKDQITISLRHHNGGFLILWEAGGKFADRNKTDYIPL